MKNKFVAFIISTCLVNFVFAQKAELGLGPIFNFHFIQSDVQSAEDSLKNLSAFRATLQAGARIQIKAGKNWMIQTGMGYQRNSSRFERTNLQFHDSIHPTIGRIDDLSQAATKSAIYRYNFDYLEIPLNFQYRINVSKGASVYTPYVVLGIQNQILLTHQLRVDLKGFTVQGENIFKVDESGWTAADYKALLNLGARFELNMSKDTWVVIQPEFKLPLLGSTTSDPKVAHGSFATWFGIARKI